ncbi:2-dehydro-3-deoxygluconokinase [Marinomonas sp. S3726]|uniref:sugar kinase n=1 Tax=Marinomonas sp. S3726 TaxID=579484 RepID=UPI0005F9D443|nr:sugar kinase [Marinomonas sp. S3726]KJZ15130.1 2-dehydro-3-deoxygluconokinase [Marinomonas sp. S3726]
MSTEILCIGEPLLEFNQMENGHYVPGHGGDTSNCAIAAARQGAKVGYFTLIGDDSFGQSFKELWKKENVDTSSIKVCKKSHTGVYFVTHSEKGHEFSYFREGSAASKMSPLDLPEKELKKVKILHVSAISQAISDTAADTIFRAIEIVKEAGGLVSYDTNLRLKLWSLNKAKSITHEAMKKCDIALPGLDDAQQLTGLRDPDQIVDFYMKLGAKIVALTLGSEGCLVATQTNRQLIQGIKVDSVDATAAGDTFDGAFLARLVAGDDPFSAAIYANTAAAISTQNYGAVSPMPTTEEVRLFMKPSF